MRYKVKAPIKYFNYGRDDTTELSNPLDVIVLMAELLKILESGSITITAEESER